MCVSRPSRRFIPPSVRPYDKRCCLSNVILELRRRERERALSGQLHKCVRGKVTDRPTDRLAERATMDALHKWIAWDGQLERLLATTIGYHYRRLRASS